jgi:hypothetical protein
MILRDLLTMSMQQHTSKKPTSATAVPLWNGFEQREFTTPTEADGSFQKVPNLQTQLSRAEQFGHHLGRVQVRANSAMATIQTKSVHPEMAAVQRQDEMDETQAKLAPQPLQREGEEEDDETQMKSEQSPVQREEEDEMDM